MATPGQSIYKLSIQDIAKPRRPDQPVIVLEVGPTVETKKCQEAPENA